MSWDIRRSTLIPSGHPRGARAGAPDLQMYHPLSVITMTVLVLTEMTNRSIQQSTS